MRYYNVLNISFQQIQIFLKVVELRNYTRVAEYFNFTVSMVSKTISNMEKEMGLILFLRNPRQMIPTPAALVLASEWHSVITTVEQSLEKAHIAQNGARKVLRVGLIDSSSEMDVRLNECLDAFEAENPNIDIHVEKLDMHELVERLNAGDMDIICTGHHEGPALDAYGLPWKMLVTCPLAVYVPRSSPLFDRETIQFSELRNEPFVIPSPVLHAYYYAVLDALCRSYGFAPKIGFTVSNVRSMAYSLQRQKGVVLSCDVTDNWVGENVKKFLLPEQGGVLIGWGRSPDGHCLSLVEHMTEYFKA